LPVQAFKPELHFADAVTAHYKKRFFAGPRDVQQVTNQKNEDYKKPHWKHNTSFILYFSNIIPRKRKRQKKQIHKK